MPDHPKPALICDNRRTSAGGARDLRSILPRQAVLRARHINVEAFGVLIDQVKPSVEGGDGRRTAACLSDGIWKPKVAIVETAFVEEVFDAAGKELFVGVEDQGRTKCLDDVEGDGGRHLEGFGWGTLKASLNLFINVWVFRYRTALAKSARNSAKAYCRHSQSASATCVQSPRVLGPVNRKL
jgi:hypothetical protein